MQWKSFFAFSLGLILLSSLVQAQSDDQAALDKIRTEIMTQSPCYEQLRFLCKQIGHRLSGSPGAEKALDWAEAEARAAGASRVWRQPVTIPIWHRGELVLDFQSPATNGEWVSIPALALGNSEGTGGQPLAGPIRVVESYEAFAALPDSQVAGHWVFFNHPFPQDLVNTFEAYGQAGKYRWHSANWVSARRGKGVIIRSLSTSLGDPIHTGSLSYADSVSPIPAVTIGNQTAEKLALWAQSGPAQLRMNSTARMKEPGLSYNLIAEIPGTDYPEEIILLGAHIDSWDLGEGAHDDGAGCVQGLELIRCFNALGWKPKRTLRVVFFMNEENGLRGGRTYADSVRKEDSRHLLAIESDGGGFSPRGLGMIMADSLAEEIRTYRDYFLPLGVYDFETESGGADISPLRALGVPLMGLIPDNQRYFEWHHSDQDVFEKVNHRELKLGAVVLTSLVYLISEHGLGSRP